ncbi:sensor histidine kinase [Peterkaempfera bronchialis]|uniref:histidine kinase n=1 Tax=Peterkaempfera bronchialis TaxID=2126346 RepID=A0A345T3F1_9ACTN|nr:ATP-binding protein [Peterkaempfera bronchialis]AXI80506.1 GHKL domain-containing protein [Peterkaempfera bronchialis]
MTAHPARLRQRCRTLLRGRHRSLAGQLFAVQIVIVAAVVAAGAVLAWLSATRRAEEAARHQATAAAVAVADAPSVLDAARGPDPSAALQPYADRVRLHTGVDFITIMDTHGIRWTHPDPAQIGRPFLGHIEGALAGGTVNETYTGTLGPSVRVVTPIRDPQGRVVGLVSAGITVESISARLRPLLLAMVGAAGAALTLGGLASYLANARLRRHTHGMGAAELGRLYEYHQATLHAVREGLLLLDRDHRVALCNDAARTLLALPDDAEGLPVDRLGLPRPLTEALLATPPRRDEVHLTAERVVVVNTSAIGGGHHGHHHHGLGTVVTFRDHTELQALTGELDSVRGFAESLRSQAHEAANRLHAMVSLIELDRTREAVDFATAELALAQELTDRVVGAVSEPVLAALLLGKAAQAAERGVDLTLTEESRLDDRVLPADLPARDLVTLLGNLIDNAVDAAIEGAAHHPGPPTVTVTARTEGGELLLRVADTGPGLDPQTARQVFHRGWSTKHRDGAPGTPGGDAGGRGLGLALVAQAARRNGGTVEVGGEVGGEGGGEGGAVFTVRLPLARHPHPRAHPHPHLAERTAAP